MQHELLEMCYINKLDLDLDLRSYANGYVRYKAPSRESKHSKAVAKMTTNHIASDQDLMVICVKSRPEV